MYKTKRTIQTQSKPSSAGFFDAHGSPALDKPTFEQDEACLEIIRHIRQTQSGIQPQFLIRKLTTVSVRMVSQKLHKNGSGDSLDEVVVIDKDAIVRRVMPNHGRRAARGDSTGNPCRRAFVRFCGMLNGLYPGADLGSNRYQASSSS